MTWLSSFTHYSKPVWLSFYCGTQEKFVSENCNGGKSSLEPIMLKNLLLCTTEKKVYIQVWSDLKAIKSLQNIYLILDFFNSADGSSGHDSYPVLGSCGSADANSHQGCHWEGKDQGRVHLSAKEQIILSYVMFNCVRY